MQCFDVANTDYGAGLPTVDGVTDNAPHINAALDAAIANGGGVIYLQPSQYKWQISRDPMKDAALWIRNSNIKLVGGGVGMTILQTAAGSQGHVLQVGEDGGSAVVGGGVENITIDGRRDTNLNGHGLRLDGVVSKWTAKHYEIVNASGYGIGAQHGTWTEVKFLHGRISHVGNDGIDIKNDNNNNQDFIIDDLVVRSHGLASQEGEPDPTIYPAVDIRGACVVRNLRIYDFGNSQWNKHGLRIRHGEASTSHGLGGMRTHVDGLRVYGNGAVGTIGFYSGHQQVWASQGYIEGCEIGVSILQCENAISQFHVEGGSVGFRLNGNVAGIDTQSDRSRLTSCFARVPGGDAINVFGKDVDLTAFHARGCRRGFVIGSTAVNTKIIGGSSTGHSGSGATPCADAGVSTFVRGVSGVADIG